VIVRPTTLILGAGASVPYGFPSGYELLKQVIARTDLDRQHHYADYFGWMGFTKADARDFREALLKSGKTSVDAFLEHRPEFVSFGKAAIAATLICFEDEQALFERNGTSWYEYLFNQLNTKFHDFNKNKLAVLTFNYDRSLEHYLFSALRHSYGKPDQECLEALRSIPIIHLHGDLGALHVGDQTGRPYSTNLTPEALQVATKGIKVIHESIDNEPQFSTAHDLLAKSEHVCFLGFGYLPLNLQRLKIPTVFSSACEVSGTSKGLTPHECNQIVTLFHSRIGLCARGSDTLMYLRETGLLWRTRQQPP